MAEAWEALARGRRTAAAQLAAEALDLGFVNPRLWLEHGQILERCGRAPEARASFHRALHLAPGMREAREALGLPPPPPEPPPPPPSTPTVALTERTSRHDWEAVGAALWRVGAVRLPALLPPEAPAVPPDLEDEVRARLLPLLAAWQTRFRPPPDLALRVALGAPRRLTYADDRFGKERVRARLDLAPGDGAVLATPTRPIQIGGAWGLQPVTIRDEPRR
jgi:hypothetical protein